MLQDTPQTLPCPVCKTLIPFTVGGLLRGERFFCPQCGGVISLSVKSRENVRDVVEKLDKIYSKNHD